MTLNVYVDAFNLYYGCLMDTPYKWLNLRTFCELSFPADHIKEIHYFTARIRPNPHDPDKHVRQDTCDSRHSPCGQPISADDG